MVQQRKTPERMCAGCMQHKPKPTLIRVVRTPSGEIVLDPTGKRSGRGVYICNDANCLRLAQKARRLERSLEGAIPPEVLERLEGALGDAK